MIQTETQQIYRLGLVSNKLLEGIDRLYGPNLALRFGSGSEQLFYKVCQSQSLRNKKNRFHLINHTCLSIFLKYSEQKKKVNAYFIQ